MQKACERCGIAFTSKERSQRFCSLMCANVRTGLYVPRRVSCDGCGAAYTTKKPSTRYCSNACRVTYGRYGRTTYGLTTRRQAS